MRCQKQLILLSKINQEAVKNSIRDSDSMKARGAVKIFDREPFRRSCFYFGRGERKSVYHIL